MKNICLNLLLLINFFSITEEYLFTFDNPRAEAYAMRLASSHAMTLQQNKYLIDNEHNGDEQNVPEYAGSFHKGLEHDTTTGLLTAQGKTSFEQLLQAIASGSQADFNLIVRAPGATMQFKSPQGAYTRSLIGVPGSTIPVAPAPQLISEEAAADIIEDYLRAICRDVAFEDYGTGVNTDVDLINGGSITNNAATILTALGDAYRGPLNNGIVTTNELFRGTTSGDLIGPFISQFWWLPIHFHYQNIEHQQYVPIAQQREFGVSWNDFVELQNGKIPKPYDNSDFAGERYIINGRDTGTIVHLDAPGDYFIHAANILLYNKAPLSVKLPYNNDIMPNECAFINMQVIDIYSSLLDVAQEALIHAWAHKWRGSRRLRPEAMSGLVHRAKITNSNPFNLHSSIFATYSGIDLLEWVKSNNKKQETIINNPLPIGQGETYLFSQLFEEASPTHPSYVAGHASIASACATIIKAFFDDTKLLHEIITPVKPDPNDPTKLVILSDEEGAPLLTVGGELDKLASNVGHAREFAGVHYRSDEENSFILGEEVALRYLQDRARRYHEQGFTGFELTKRNGEHVLITAETIIVIS